MAPTLTLTLGWFIRAVTALIVSNHEEEGSEGAVKKEAVRMGSYEGGEKATMMNGELSMFQMPLHYPRHKKEDYMKMEEWKVDMLLREYGLVFEGSLEEKRAYAMGAFLWPSQL